MQIRMLLTYGFLDKEQIDTHFSRQVQSEAEQDGRPTDAHGFVEANIFEDSRNEDEQKRVQVNADDKHATER